MPALILIIAIITGVLLLFTKVAWFTVPAFLVVAAIAVFGASVKQKGK